jgi:hypothetical protein
MRYHRSDASWLGMECKRRRLDEDEGMRMSSLVLRLRQLRSLPPSLSFLCSCTAPSLHINSAALPLMEQKFVLRRQIQLLSVLSEPTLLRNTSRPPKSRRASGKQSSAESAPHTRPITSHFVPTVCRTVTHYGWKDLELNFFKYLGRTSPLSLVPFPPLPMPP